MKIFLERPIKRFLFANFVHKIPSKERFDATSVEQKNTLRKRLGHVKLLAGYNPNLRQGQLLWTFANAVVFKTNKHFTLRWSRITHQLTLILIWVRARLVWSHCRWLRVFESDLPLVLSEFEIFFLFYFFFLEYFREWCIW